MVSTDEGEASEMPYPIVLQAAVPGDTPQVLLSLPLTPSTYMLLAKAGRAMSRNRAGSSRLRNMSLGFRVVAKIRGSFGRWLIGSGSLAADLLDVFMILLLSFRSQTGCAARSAAQIEPQLFAQWRSGQNRENLKIICIFRVLAFYAPQLTDGRFIQ
jgi:hypothetical protein